MSDWIEDISLERTDLLPASDTPPRDLGAAVVVPPSCAVDEAEIDENCSDMAVILVHWQEIDPGYRICPRFAK